MMRTMRFFEAIREATDLLLTYDERVYVIGLGVPDPKGIFGTTVGLAEKFGSQRVMDMPTSENAMTGIAIGSAIAGLRPIMTHQRVDFFLLALDQLINNGAKWKYMFNDQMQVPLVIRLVVGRGWGQGPQHSQTLHGLFAHIPGIKVVMPSTPYDAKGLLISASKEDCPVIFFEHRWLHHLTGDVPVGLYDVPIGQAQIVKEGSDITIIASSHMSVEARRAALLLKNEAISAEVVDLRTIKPLDKETILKSVKKTGRVIVVDPDWRTCGLSGEIISLIAENEWAHLKTPPKRITFPDAICPTSWKLANHYYPGFKEIAIAALQMLDQKAQARTLLESVLEAKMQQPQDTPDKSFAGPF